MEEAPSKRVEIPAHIAGVLKQMHTMISQDKAKVFLSNPSIADESLKADREVVLAAVKQKGGFFGSRMNL